MTNMFNSPAQAIACLNHLGILHGTNTHEDGSVSVYLQRNIGLDAYHQEVVTEAIDLIISTENGRYAVQYPFGRSLFTEPPVSKQPSRYARYTGGANLIFSTPAPKLAEDPASIPQAMSQVKARWTSTSDNGHGMATGYVAIEEAPYDPPAAAPPVRGRFKSGAEDAQAYRAAATDWTSASQVRDFIRQMDKTPDAA